jgi:hypothetical protein
VKKISTRFAILMAAVAVVPLLAFGAASGYFLSTGTRETVVLGLGNVAQRAADQIELYVLDSIRILQGLAANLDDTDLLTYQQERMLRNYALDLRGFRELTLLDGDGNLLATSRLDSATVTIPGSDSEVVPGVLMSSFSLDAAGLPETVLSVRIEDKNRTRWLVARVSLEDLWEMVDGIKVGSQGFALVATKNGDLIAHGEPESKSLVAQRYDMKGHPLMALAPADDATQTTPSAQYPSWPAERKGRGELLGVKAEIPEFGWIVAVEQPISEAFKVPRQMRDLLIVAIAVALFVMLTVGYFFGRRFINPILRLTRGTRALAEGHLEERVVVDSRDELGQLGSGRRCSGACRSASSTICRRRFRTSATPAR